jgi:hypothetical protein
MAENGQTQTNYIDALQQALIVRKDWLEKEEMAKLKDDLRAYQSSFASLYNLFLKKKLIDEDPYKQETKISELEVPETGPINEAKRVEQVSIRLSNYDSQLDFLVNFYQLGIDFLNLDRIKRIVGVVRYIEWTSLTPDNPSVMTKTVAELAQNAKAGVDPITLNIIGESLSRLSKSTASVMAIMKNLSTYYREDYKLAVRLNVTKDLPANAATVESIKKKMHSAMPVSPFYKELIEELIKEDYSNVGSELKQTILNNLKVAEEKPKAAKPATNFKAILLDGIQVIGGASNSLNEIMVKLDENQAVMENHKKGFFEAIRELIRQLTHAEPEEVIYTVEYMDGTKGIPAKEKVNFYQFREDVNKKTKILASFNRGSAYQKLSAMTEEQIIGYLDRNIKDVQHIHKTLSALDDFFKTHVQEEDRSKVKGTKPELSALKNSYIKANQLRYDYTAQKEEEAQLARLGVSPAMASGSPIVSGGGAPAAPAAAPAAAAAPAKAAPAK